MKKQMKRFILLTALLSVVLMGSQVMRAVSFEDLQGWTFVVFPAGADTDGRINFAFVDGPGGGTSFFVNVIAANAKVILTAPGTYPLSDLASNFSFSTFVESAYTGNQNFYINMQLIDITDPMNPVCFGRLDYQPPNASVQKDVIQVWNAATGTWFRNANYGTSCFGGVSGTSTTLAGTITAEPGRTIVARVIFNMGDTATTYVGFRGNIFWASIAGTVFDFGAPAGASVAGCPGLTVRGEVTLRQIALGYGEPGGQLIRNPDGTPLNVFNDANNDGFDTFLLVDEAVANDKAWYGVFLGVCRPVYIEADLATRSR